MAGGTITLVWDRSDAAQVTISTSGGHDGAFSVDGSPISFPHALSETTSFDTNVDDTYVLSVVYGGIEIAGAEDGNELVVSITGGGGRTALTIAPSPQNGFSSGVGATETAYFIGTASGDASADADLPATFEADDRHGALPSWASVVAGNPTLGADAGTCAFAIAYQTTFDFTGGTPATGSNVISDYLKVNLDGGVVIAGEAQDNGDGNGEAVQTGLLHLKGGVLVGETVTVSNGPFGDDGNNGHDSTAVTQFALTITRIAQAPVLPS